MRSGWDRSDGGAKEVDDKAAKDGKVYGGGDH
jgi:hypothetical protein